MVDSPLVFVSYAHRDLDWLEELRSHLGPHLRAGKLSLWDDTRMVGGDDWEVEIEKAMRACRLCILLVSRHSLTSDYIDRVEMKTILERVAAEGLRIYPIFVSPVAVPKKHWLRKFNWRPRDGRPLKTFAEATGERDAEFVKIVEELATELGKRTRKRAVPKGGASAGATSVGAVPPVVAAPAAGTAARSRRANEEPPIIRSGEDLERWLKGKPREFGRVLAVRAALRVAPLLANLRSRESGETPPSSMLLPFLRGMAATWAAAKYPARGPEVYLTRAAGYAAAYAYAYATAATAADAAADAATAAYAAAYAADAADTTTAAADAAAAAAAADTAWEACTSDVASLHRTRDAVALAAAPLWPAGAPRAVVGAMVDLSNRLLSRKAERWHPWLAWLNDRLSDDPARLMGDEEKELARLTVPEELWEEAARSTKGVVALNIGIERRLRAIDVAREANRKPERPRQEKGQAFQVAERGLEATSGPRPLACDGLTLRLHDQIRHAASEVRLATGNVGNRLAFLSRTIDAYAAAVAPEYGDIDLFQLWSAGVALIEMTDAQRREMPNADTALDAEQKGLLQTLAALHSNFIHRIPEIRDEFNVPEIERSSGAVLAAIKPPMQEVLRNLRNLERGIESKTKRLLEIVSIGYEASEGDYPEGVKSAYLSLSNALIAISDHIDVIESATPDGCRDVVEAVITTDPEDTRALIGFFRANETEIRQFSEPFSKLGIWIDWVYSRLDRLKNF